MTLPPLLKKGSNPYLFKTLACSLLLTGCSGLPKSAARQDFDFSTIRAIGVQAQDGLGALVSRELLLLGLNPHARSQNKSKINAILKVAVTRMDPQKRYIVQTTKKKLAQQTTTSQKEIQTSNAVEFIEETGHQPIEVSGSSPYTQSIWNAPDARLIATYAQVFLSGELIEPKSDEILWAGTYSYEGIDQDSALEGAVRGLINEIPFKGPRKN